MCQTFSIASSVTATWQRPSDAVHQLMSDTMMQATGFVVWCCHKSPSFNKRLVCSHCCLKYSTTDDVAKCQLDLLTSRYVALISFLYCLYALSTPCRVMQRLLSVKAPEDNRLDDYHGARTSMVSCVTISILVLSGFINQMCVGSELTEAMTASQKVKHKLKKQKR